MNHYYPTVLRNGPLSLISMILLLSKLAAVLFLGLFPTTAHLSTITVNRVLELTNQERTKKGLPALTVNAKLVQAAQSKANDMIAKDYFAHISPDGLTPWHWIRQAGYAYSLAGENLAIDFHQAEDLVAAWMASASHRDNLVNKEYTETGIAVLSGEFEGSTSIIVVHVFGSPSQGPAAPVAQTTTPTTTIAPTPKPQNTSTALPAPKVVVSPDTIAPEAPELSLSVLTTAVKDTLSLTVEAELLSLVTVFINDETVHQFTQSRPSVTQDIAIKDIPDGTLAVTANSQDARGNTSKLSATLSIEKDTTPPGLNETDIPFLVAPRIDVPAVIFPALPIGNESISFESDSPLLALPNNQYSAPLTKDVQLIARDIHGNTVTLQSTLQPQFQTDPAPYRLGSGILFTELYKNLALLVLVTISFVFVITVVIRFHDHQRGFVSHTSFVLFLAAILFFTA